MAEKKDRFNVKKGVVHIRSTFNNTIITITDVQGNTLSWASSGTVGFKGSRKSTPFAAQMAAEKAMKAAMDRGLKTVDVMMQGPGSGKEAALRTIKSLQGLVVENLKDITNQPHNGCRPPKRRRM
jgi:small subunit ribosomal protein S11